MKGEAWSSRSIKGRGDLYDSQEDLPVHVFGKLIRPGEEGNESFMTVFTLYSLKASALLSSDLN